MRRAYAGVRRAARVLANADGAPAGRVRRRLAGLLATLARWQPRAGALGAAVAHCRRVTRSYWPGLFACYTAPGVPRTNNALEQLFGAARYRERRASGRRGASPALVLRGSVRVVAGAATLLGGVDAAALAPADVGAWRALRARLEVRHEGRRRQLRFRRDPAGYLSVLEAQLQSLLPS